MLAHPSPARLRTLIRHSRMVWLHALMLGILCLLPLELFAETEQLASAQLNNETLDQQYQAAKEYFTLLERDRSLGKDRTNWLNGTRNFRRIHLAQKKGPFGPTSLFMLAKMSRRMFEQFKFPIDLENATEQFTEVATLYPAHSLADDALYDAAECARLGKGTEQQANSLYNRIIEVYPKSEFYPKALARIQEGQEKKPAPLSPSPGGDAVSVANHLARISPVKYWSTTDYTRIVIQTTAPVSFNSSIVEKTGEQPNKLFVDFAHCYIPQNLREPIVIQEGLLKQIKPGQFSSDTVRVALDIGSVSEYKVFSLNDPFRVIVDIHGQTPSALPNELTSKPTLPATSPPAPPKRETSEGLQDNSPKSVITTLPVVNEKSTNAEKSVISLEDQKKRSPKIEISKKPMGHEKISLAQQLGLGVRKIVIDPGHGGKDPGAMAYDLKEKDIVLKVSKKIAKILKSSYRYEVALTRTKDVYIALEERTAIANTQNSDLFISIHVNAHPDKTIGGIETYFLNLATNADAMRVAALENATSTHKISELQDILANLMKNSKIDESSRLAQFVQTNLVSGVELKYKTRNLGVKQAPFYVLIGAQMPAILAEISFITNPEEAKLLQDEQYLDKIAQQIAAGIAAYVDHHHTAAIKL